MGGLQKRLGLKIKQLQTPRSQPKTVYVLTCERAYFRYDFRACIFSIVRKTFRYSYTTNDDKRIDQFLSLTITFFDPFLSI